VRLVPNQNLLLLAVPKQTGVDSVQFVQSINSQGWAVYRDIPYFTGDTWHSQYYIGTDDNRVLLHTGSLDNVLLANPDAATQVEWSGIMGFRDYGPPGTYNRAHFIRPVFMAEQAPSYNVAARYDYNITEATAPPDAVSSTGALWDSAIWDVSLWGGDFQIIDNVRGAAGMGRSIAIALNGRSASNTTLLRFDVMADGGGLL
jgi:hypothetical protein